MLQSLRIFVFVLLVGVGGGVRLFGDPASLGTLQFYLFPLLLFLFGTSKFIRSFSPFLRYTGIGILVLLFFGSLVSRFLMILRSPPGEGVFEVAILADDSFGGLSRAIRAEILRYSTLPFVVKTVNARILDAASARTYLNNHGDVRTLIWGTRERFVLEQQSAGSVRIREVLNTVSPLNEMTLIRDVPRLLLPADDAFHSFLYLARLLSGAVLTDTDEAGAVSRIRSAAFLRGQWPGQSHLAYAFWKSGTLILQQGLRSEMHSVAYINCALASFRVAWRMLTVSDNPYLAAAILNNHGVALAAKGVFEVAPAQLRMADSTLRKGRHIIKTMKFEGAKLNASGDRSFLGSSISGNLRVLSDYGIWNKLPLVRRVKKPSLVKKSRRKDKKKGEMVHGGQGKDGSGPSHIDNRTN